MKQRSFKYSDKALDEQSRYKLNDNPEYQRKVGDYYAQAEFRYARYGYWVGKDTATRNMLKALRMMPWENTADDWARLHVTEGCMRMN